VGVCVSFVICGGVCEFCNLWVVSMCGYCNVLMCVFMGFVMCGCASFVICAGVCWFCNARKCVWFWVF